MHRIVVVGGGAGGLELVTRLGNVLGAQSRHPKAHITLVDMNPTHLWKPLLHAVASGSINVGVEQLEYAAQAQWHGFHFEQGTLHALDRAQHCITLKSPIAEKYHTLSYDTLIIAIGSLTHFFNVSGAETYSFALDTAKQAEQLRCHLLAACLQTQQNTSPPPLRITIIGAGATGVELSAELRHTVHTLRNYRLHVLDPKREIQITLIEASSRILPALPERLAAATSSLLHKLSITTKVNAVVTQVEEKAVHLKGGEIIPSDLTVWAAGIKAPPVLATLEGLEVNKQGQIMVNPALQSINDPDIFALGDCASCPRLGYPPDVRVPPRAQAAHQQASFLFKQLKSRLRGKPLTKPFRYRDFGALVSLGHSGAVGNLRDGLTRQGLFIRGWFAKWLYLSLYRLHLAALHGWRRMILDTFGKWLSRSTRPRIKLH
jgi:NADH:ubiquinone reductase (H+-translocating)